MRQHHHHDSTDGTTGTSTGATARSTARSTTLRDHSETVLDVFNAALILVVLASLVFFAVGGLRAAVGEPACGSDFRALGGAAEVFFVQHGAATIPATGTGHDRYERTLVDLGLIRADSDLHDLDADGAVTPEGDSPC
jgi:hypothetical protein